MEALILAFTVVTSTFNLPPGLLRAVCYAESSHRTDIIHLDDGGEDSLGVCQVQLPTARTLGFKGTSKQLMVPRVNVYYAGKYLHRQLRRYSGSIPKAVASYNTGTYYSDKKGLPVNQKYVLNVLRAWTEGR